MDYTTTARVKSEIHASETTDDVLLALLVTAASRAIDRKCTGVPDTDSADYFKSETKTDELIEGMIDGKGNIMAYPHKPTITSVSAFAFRTRPFDPWIIVESTRVEAVGHRVEAWPQTVLYTHTRCRVKLTYIGGLAADVTAVPADLQEAATVLAVRYYREAEGGLTDAIGVAELTTLVYTKAWPVRVLDMIQPYMRRVGWGNIG